MSSKVFKGEKEDFFVKEDLRLVSPVFRCKAQKLLKEAKEKEKEKKDNVWVEKGKTMIFSKPENVDNYLSQGFKIVNNKDHE